MPRPFMSDCSINLFAGLLSLQVDLVPVVETKKSPLSLRMICPHCEADGILVKPTQRYLCSEDPTHSDGEGEGFSSGTLHKAQEIGSGKSAVLHPITEEEIEAVKEPELAPKELTLECYPAGDVDAATVPAGPAYRLRAERGLPQLAMLTDLIALRTDLAFMGELNTGRGGQKVYRLSTLANGELVLQEVTRPEEFIPGQKISAEYPDRLLDLAKTQADALVQPFDADAFASKVKQRAAALADAKRNGEAMPVAAAAPKAKGDGVDDLLAALESSLATVAKPKRATARKAS